MKEGSVTPVQWTSEDISDLQLCAEIGDTVQAAAKFLGCSEEELRRLAKECGLVLKDEAAKVESKTRSGT